MAVVPCPQCGDPTEQRDLYQERLEYVRVDQKKRLRTHTMRVVCSTCANLNIDTLPSYGSWVDVIARLKEYAVDQTDPMWERVEKAAGPFLAMGVQPRLL